MFDNPTRRDFLTGLGAIGLSLLAAANCNRREKELPARGKKKRISIRAVDSNFEREPLIRPFGFKGGYMSEIWQTAALLESESGRKAVGLCSQSVLWSDAEVFLAHSEAAGNALMYAMLEHGLREVEGAAFGDPIELLEMVLPGTYEYGRKITHNPQLRETFALNSLVALDNAAWLLYAGENGISDFDELIPEAYRPGLSHHHDRLASIPLMAYGIPLKEIIEAVEDGYFFLKIKIGAPGDQDKMLKADKARVEAIHKAIGGVRIAHTSDGKIPYYFDANGRYEKKETLLRLIEHLDKIGALERTRIIEEPFPEEYEEYVGDLGIRIAADESAHTDRDAARRIEMGYSAIAVKAIAKTLSMTLKVIKVAHEKGIPCFCADLTVNPILVEWNKNVAARLAPFPGLGMGLLETNGHQNYKRWEEMKKYHPYNGASWTQTKEGLFNLNDDYYEKSGGIFEKSQHFEDMFVG